jgi:hypothetical protein
MAKPVFVGICHMTPSGYKPHKLPAKIVNKYLAKHPDDILMPEDGICPVVVDDEADDLPEVEV